MAVAVTVVAYFLPELLLLQPRPGAAGGDRARAGRHPRPDDHRGRGRPRLRVGDGAGRRATARDRWPRSWCGPCRTSPSGSRAARPTWRWPSGPASPDLRRFIRAVVQADAYGVSIADVLRTQAQEMRLKRRQRAEEKAMQIPVKVIFPLILCILPTLFIVLLGLRRRPSWRPQRVAVARRESARLSGRGSPWDGGLPAGRRRLGSWTARQPGASRLAAGSPRRAALLQAGQPVLHAVTTWNRLACARS